MSYIIIVYGLLLPQNKIEVPDFNLISRAIPSIKALVEPVSLRYRTTYEIEIWECFVFCGERSSYENIKNTRAINSCYGLVPFS